MRQAFCYRPCGHCIHRRRKERCQSSDAVLEYAAPSLSPLWPIQGYPRTRLRSAVGKVFQMLLHLLTHRQRLVVWSDRERGGRTGQRRENQVSSAAGNVNAL
jgi:hypothetical protein